MEIISIKPFVRVLNINIRVVLPNIRNNGREVVTPYPGPSGKCSSNRSKRINKSELLFTRHIKF